MVKATGVYTIQNVASGYYLNGGGANIHPDNLTNITQKTRNNNTLTPDYLSQWWKIKYLSNGLYSIRPMHKLDMGLHGTASDVSLQQIGTTDTEAGVTASARWSISYKSNGYELKSDSEPYRALSPHQGATAENATVVTVSYTGSTAQRWRLIAVEPPPATILFYHTISGEVLTNPEFHIAEGQTKGFDNWFVIPAVVSGDTNYQNVILVQPETGGVTVNSGQVIAGIQSGEAERYVNITVWGASDADAQGTFTLKVLDESRAIYYDHYYVDGLIEDELLAKISTAVSFADHVFCNEFNISLTSSGSPQIHSEITDLLGGCDPDLLGAGITCTPSSCDSACGIHHRSVLNIRALQAETPRAENHISVFWANQASGFFCTINDDGEHEPADDLGVCPQYEPYIRIIQVLGNDMEQKEACMGIVLAHETVHALAMKDVYNNAGHDTAGETNCIMEVYEEDILPLHRQFYEAILSGTSAFCGGCEETIRRDMLTEIFGNL